MPTLPSAADMMQLRGPSPGRSINVSRVPGPDASAGRIAGQLGELIDAEVDRIDGLAAEDALNKLRMKRVELTMGPEQGFQRFRGGDVVGRPVLQEFPAQFDQAIDELGAGLRSNQARARFKQRAAQEATGYRTDLIRHVATQTEEFRNQVFAGTLETEKNYAASMWNDPIAVEGAIGRMEAATADDAARRGLLGSPEGAKAAEAFMQSNVGDVVSSAVRGALEAGDSQAAKGLFEQYGDKMTARQKQGIAPALRSAEAWDKGQDLGQKAFDMLQNGKSLVEIEEKLQAETRGAKEVYSNAKTVFNQLEGARREQRDQMAERALDEMNRGASWGQIRGKYLNTLNPKAIDAFDRKAEMEGRGQSVKTDFETWYDLVQLAGGGEEALDEFAGTDLNEYADRIAPSDLKGLANVQAQIRSGTRDASAATLVQQVNAAIAQQTWNKSNPANKVKQGQFTQYIQQRVDEELRATGKRRLSDRERAELIADALAPVEVPGRLWGTNTIHKFEQFYRDQRQAAQQQGRPSEANEPIDEPTPETVVVPITARADIIRRFVNDPRSGGRRPTEDEIQRIYRSLTGN